MSPSRPTQTLQLDCHEVDDGYVVYDNAANRVHYLNPTAVLVFELCTGEHDDEQIATLVGRAYGLDEPPVAAVADCLALLRRERLVV